MRTSTSTGASATDVPATFEEFAQRYYRLINYGIRYVSRGRVSRDDMEDLRQQILLRVWEKKYLDRCRELIIERGGGKFSTYLFHLIRSVCVNQFAKNGRDPLNGALRVLDPRERRIGRIDVPGTGLTRAPYGTVDIEASRCDTAFEDRLLDRDTLQRLHVFINTTRRGARLSRTLQLLYEGYSMPEITAMTRSKKRCRVVKDRRDLRAALTDLTRAS